MKTSTNQIRKELEAVANAHDQLNSFFWGDFNRAYKERSLTYPLLCGYFPTGTMFNNTTPIDLYIIICDKTYKSLSNLNDTESDTLQVARDVFNVINRSARWGRIGRIDSAVFSKFIYGTDDECAGVSLNLKITLFDSNSICAIPLTDYSMDGSAASTCEPVRIYENDVLVATIPSGGQYEYTSGGGVATVTNSDDSYTAEVDAGETLVLPDTTINVFVDEVLQDSVTFATLSDQTINISN